MGAKLSGGGGGKGMQPNAEPNVIPFIDIMLVMLIIFMVAAPPPTVDIKVDLPPPGRPIFLEQQDKPTIVAIDENAGVLTYFIGEEQVPYAAIKDRLFALVSKNNPSMAGDATKLFSEAKIFVDADQDTSYTNVVGLINEIDSTGFKKVSLLVKEAAT